MSKKATAFREEMNCKKGNINAKSIMKKWNTKGANTAQSSMGIMDQ
jgi:hypothetical protein